MIASVPQEKLAQLTAAIPMGRIADASEMAAAVAFLASDEASYITGVVLPVTVAWPSDRSTGAHQSPIHSSVTCRTIRGGRHMTTATTTLAEGFNFLEAPRWREGRLWFSDFYGYRVRSMHEDGTDLRVEADVPGQPSGLGWLPDGRLLVVSMRDRRVLRREPDGTLSVHAELSGHATGHTNDMVVNEHGRAYVGNFGFDLMAGAPLEPAALHRVDPDGRVTQVADDLWFPNGSVLTPDNVLLVVETFGNRVTAFTVTDDGELTDRRVWAEFGPLPTDRDAAGALGQLRVAGDGAYLDAEGGLWIADATGNRLLRVIEGGAVTDEIRPGTPVYACALGGAGGDTLFVCAAPDFHEQARKAAAEARMLAVGVRVPAA